MSAPAVTCPPCQAPLATSELLDSASVAFPEGGLLLFRCPRCGAAGLARLADGHVAVGPGDDPARFEPSGSTLDPQLSVRVDAGWLDCWYGGRYRRFPARVVARALGT